MPTSKIWKGRAYPLGATWTGSGVNFALFSENATGVELCLFDRPEDGEPKTRIRVSERDDHVWHVFLPEAKPGQLYGYRVDGPYAPQDGHRFNPAKLLLDPYAFAICGPLKWGPEMFGYVIGSAEADLSKDGRDNAASIPKSAVIDPTFRWGGDKPPGTPIEDTVIYEIHVKGYSKLMNGLKPELRGTYAGLASEESVKYLKGLGVTAVELLPIHQHVTSQHLLDKGLSDYWGYNTIGFFAPEASYSASGDRGGQVREFKEMVRSLHKAGLEVILDVVYNHTVEGNQLGPTLCFRGIDNAAYYRLVADNRRYYNDYTGTGNTLNVVQPRVLQLIMDSLRYWITEMHVDGFRFDLAATLARELHAVSRLSAFFDCIHQDPVISQAKLIAEPWDVGEGGYQVGNFPVLWAEWNGRYRDTMRRFWKGDGRLVSEFANRLCGSSDLYERGGKKPTASINFITAHDGFTLKDLVSFDGKHNEANGEGNKDGESNNNSWNCGFEGLDAPPEVRALRRQMLRNHFATLLLSLGVPMIRGGDEFGATQRGNNNAYCQDNEIGWLDWNWDEDGRLLQEFVRRLIRIRRDHPVFRQPHFFEGRDVRGRGVKDLTWINAEGREMSEQDWQADSIRVLGVMFAGDSSNQTDYYGDPVRDDTFLLYFNGHHEDAHIRICEGSAIRWRELVDTARPEGLPGRPRVKPPGSHMRMKARSLVVFRRIAPADGESASPNEAPTVEAAGLEPPGRKPSESGSQPAEPASGP
ncbi:MAG: glycogen debranching protein GlgX [Opitutaceae bacterium]